MPLELTLNPPEGIVAGPKSEDNFFEWEALITYVSMSCDSHLIIVFLEDQKTVHLKEVSL